MNKTTVDHQGKTASSLLTTQGILQRQCACGNHTIAGGECADCAKTKSGLQRKLAIGASNDPLEREADRVADQVMAVRAHPAVSGAPPRIQRYAGQATEGTDTASTSVERVLASSGRALGPALEQDMEQRFGHDFSQVRVHTGGAADQSARDIGARAYTAGSSIVFAEGQYSTSTDDGKRLLAHELAHVVQQRKASLDRHVIRRTPWGTCPEGPRRSALNPFIYGPAELYAVGQYMVQHSGHCLLTNEMLAAGIVPPCRDDENATVAAIMRDFHHEHEVTRRSVGSIRDVTRRPESKSGALIQSGLEKVKALQQPDIIDVTSLEVYDVTTVGQRHVKSNKFRSRYLPLLNAITRLHWSAGKELRALSPLTYKVPKLGTICYGPTDLNRWPGVIQYEVIKPEDDKKKKGKKKKETKEDEKKKKGQKEGEEEKKKKGGAPGGNVGFGIGILSSGGGKGNAVLGVAINAHGSAYGTASAGIIYDANGNAVGAASVGAGAHVSGDVVGSATAGVGSHTSAEAALTATAGKGKDTDAFALANASAGSSESSSTVTIATASHGEGKDIAETSMAKTGYGSGSGQPGGDKPSGQPAANPAAGTAGIQIPGLSDAETAKAVADAARIDAELQKATGPQKDLLAYLARQSPDLEYEVPDISWVHTFMTATAGLSEADIKFLQTQHWEPGNVTAEELRKQIDERLKNRNKPQGTGHKDAGHPDKKKDTPVAKEAKPDDKGSAAGMKKPDDGVKAANLDETADPKHAESDQEAYKRLLDRARKYDWAHMRAFGVLHYGKEGKVYAPKTVSGTLYISTEIKGKRVRVTADVSGILRKGKGEDILEIRASSIVVATDGRAGSGSMLAGQQLQFSL